MASFDPKDKNSWYFGPMTREEAVSILQSERDSGVFLVRDSASIRGDFVLCCKEENRVCHYIINKIQVSGMTRFRIGDQEFPDLPSLLSFYTTHYLDTTSLIRPATREKYVALFDFLGNDPEDLPFKKGEVLTILTREEEQWWRAKNNSGNIGVVPRPYIKRVEDSGTEHAGYQRPSAEHPPENNSAVSQETQHNRHIQRNLPARARVIKDRIPNAYDLSALRFKVGDIVTVTKTHISGQWEGEMNGKTGHFPFTHVEFIEDDDEDK